ncbi:MAG: twin-arginine translocase subunit TatC [Firmicutes bacterium]|nr:twin-arginine translocase subunit TatC [Bacillota bacterium]
MDPELKQSFFEHISELRKTLIWCVITLLIAFVAVFCLLNDVLMDILLKSLRDLGLDVIYTMIGEVWVTKMKVSFIGAFIVSFPLLSFYVWRFLAPALYPHEKKIFRGCYFISIVLFLLGVAFAYFVVLPFTVRFFISFGEGTADAMLTVSKYISFLFSFVIPFGLIFLMPLVVYALVKLGLLSPAVLVKTRKYVMLLLLILAAVLTPPDVISQLMLFFPMMLLWEIGIFVSKRTKPLRYHEE